MPTGTGHEGEYPQPQLRTTNVRLPMVSGYTTGRLQAATIAVSGYVFQQTQVLLKNAGTTAFTLQMQESTNYTSGPRTNVGGAIALVPAGVTQVSIGPTKPYLEFNCTAGSGQLHAQLSGMQKWNLMAFDKTETVYPSSLTKMWPDSSPPPANLL